jgi:MerR family copper efflux transcriptional regulator
MYQALRNLLPLNSYLRIKDAAKFLGVSTNTLRNWEKDKKIKVARHPWNKYRLYKKEDLEEILNSITCTTNGGV